MDDCKMKEGNVCAINQFISDPPTHLLTNPVMFIPISLDKTFSKICFLEIHIFQPYFNFF